MDTDRETAWQDLGNRASTARQPQPTVSLSRLNKAEADLASSEQALLPCLSAVAVEMLRPCLMLCAPSGMTEDDRAAWIAAALATIGYLPDFVLRDATAHARRVADHPAKIVPAIIAFSEEPMAQLRKMRRRAEEDLAAARRFRLSAPTVDDDTRREVATGLGDLVKELTAQARAE